MVHDYHNSLRMYPRLGEALEMQQGRIPGPAAGYLAEVAFMHQYHKYTFMFCVVSALHGHRRNCTPAAAVSYHARTSPAGYAVSGASAWFWEADVRQANGCVQWHYV